MNIMVLFTKNKKEKTYDRLQKTLLSLRCRKGREETEWSSKDLDNSSGQEGAELKQINGLLIS